jgi:hypothetical protein
MILRSRQAKSAIQGPMGTWRRNRAPVAVFLDAAPEAGLRDGEVVAQFVRPGASEAGVFGSGHIDTMPHPEPVLKTPGVPVSIDEAWARSVGQYLSVR